MHLFIIILRFLLEFPVKIFDTVSKLKYTDEIVDKLSIRYMKFNSCALLLSLKYSEEYRNNQNLISMSVSVSILMLWALKINDNLCVRC